MRLMIFLVLMVTLQNLAKADTINSAASNFSSTVITATNMRGGHPAVMKMLWNQEISADKAASIQNCIEELSSDTPEEILPIDVSFCIKENK